MSGVTLMRIIAAAVALVLGALPSSVLACSVCFGKSDSDMAKGLHAGVVALLLVVGTVLGGFVAFFVYLAKRSSLSAGPASGSAEGPIEPTK